MHMSSRISAPLACVALAFAPAPAQAVPALPATAAQELFDADVQFASEGADDNIADSIAAMLAPNAISSTQGTFARGKEDIVARLRANPANANATAEWAPVRAGIAADGLQGFTYGFMTVHVPEQPDLRLKYMSYWVKRPEGWRVFGYKRALSPAGSVSTAVRPPALPPRMIPERPSVELRSKYKASLAARETAFSDRAQVVGLGNAFVEFGSADAANFGGGSDYVYGNVAIGADIGSELPAPVTWAADENTTVSSTGDLGINFGWIRITGTTNRIPFFTIWRRNATNDPWLYVAE